jgi:hypothetical protein
MNTGTTLQFGLITDGEGIIIDDNQNDQSDSVAYVGRTLVSNNLVFNCGSAGISSNLSNNVDVCFNTCYNNQNFNCIYIGEITDYHTNGSTYYNNICVGLSTVPTVYSQYTGTTTWSNNAFSGGNASHALPGSNNVTANPNFISPGITSSANFMLQAGSPAINAASATFNRTQNGAKTLPGGYAGTFGSAACLGAYEFHSAPTLSIL